MPDSSAPGAGASLSARRAWIEITFYGSDLVYVESLSARRAWIEIRTALFLAPPTMVALRKESVDRNVNLRVLDGSKSSVALRKESVDRNNGSHYDNYNLHVALRKESVDRNLI